MNNQISFGQSPNNFNAFQSPPHGVSTEETSIRSSVSPNKQGYVIHIPARTSYSEIRKSQPQTVSSPTNKMAVLHRPTIISKNFDQLSASHYPNISNQHLSSTLQTIQ